MAAWYDIVSGGKGPLLLDRIGDVGRVAALGSWRVTQGVYRFDQDLYEAVKSTPLEGNLPAADPLPAPRVVRLYRNPGNAGWASPCFFCPSGVGRQYGPARVSIAPRSRGPSDSAADPYWGLASGRSQGVKGSNLKSRFPKSKVC